MMHHFFLGVPPSVHCPGPQEELEYGPLASTLRVHATGRAFHQTPCKKLSLLNKRLAAEKIPRTVSVRNHNYIPQKASSNIFSVPLKTRFHESPLTPLAPRSR